MPHSIVPKQRKKPKNGSRGRRFVIGIAVLVAFLLGSQAALAYNYSGYRWGGSWPKPIVDYSGIYITDWRIRLQNTINDWNATGAKFIFRSGSSNNDILAYTEDSGTIAYVQVYRQFGNFGGNIVKAVMKINTYHQFSPPSAQGFDFSTIVRHEYGHWLKLLHNSYPSLMQESYGWGEIQYVDADARAGIRSIYGVQ